jgi:hypothetical protein
MYKIVRLKGSDEYKSVELSFQSDDIVQVLNVGDFVTIQKPDYPAIAWNLNGDMDVFDGGTYSISEIRHNLFSVGGFRWVFSFDCINPNTTNTMQELEEGQVLDYRGNAIDESDAIEITYGRYKGNLISQEDAIRLENDEYVTPHDRVIEMDNGEYCLEDDASDYDYFHVSYGCNRGWHHADDVVWVDNCCEYYHVDSIGEYIYMHSDGDYRDYEEENLLRHSYHSQRRPDLSTDETEFRIGFEVEKEDLDVLESYELSDVDYTKWCREEDGSLDDESGFELVSPTFDLMTDDLDESVKSDIVSAHINANYTTNCGGHVNVSRDGVSGRDFYDQIVGFVPLLFGMYRGRLGGSWAYFRTADQMRDGSRYNAVHVSENRIEFRIFSAVRSVDNILWRRDLMRIMVAECDNNRDFMWWLQQAITDGTELRNHLLKVYDAQALNKRIMWACGYADKFYETNSYLDLEIVPGEAQEKSQVRSSLAI